jgi:hypothetical protein
MSVRQVSIATGGLGSLHVFEGRNEDVAQGDDLIRSVSWIFLCISPWYTDILVFEMFEKLQLAVGALRQDWSTERLHDLLNRNILPCELIFCRAVQSR